MTGIIQAQQEGQRLSLLTGLITSDGDVWWRVLGVYEGDVNCGSIEVWEWLLKLIKCCQVFSSFHGIWPFLDLHALLNACHEPRLTICGLISPSCVFVFVFVCSYVVICEFDFWIIFFPIDSGLEFYPFPQRRCLCVFFFVFVCLCLFVMVCLSMP